MKKVILTTMIFLLLLEGKIFAQNNFSIQFGGGYIFSSIDGDKLPYWENGFSFSIATEYRLNEILLFYIYSSYQRYLFNENLITLAVPEVVGYRFIVNGEKSRIFEISFGSKLFVKNDSKIKPYLGVGLGAIFLKQGRIEITDWMEGEQNKSTHLYSNTGRSYNLAQYNIGIGLEINLTNNLQLVLDGRMVNSFNMFSYYPITTSIKFGL